MPITKHFSGRIAHILLLLSEKRLAPRVGLVKTTVLAQLFRRLGNMPRIDITDISDARLDPFRDLPNAGADRHRNHFVAEGQVLVERLAASDFEMTAVITTEYLAHHAMNWGQPDTPVYVMDKEHVNELIGFRFHRGILALARRKPPRPPHELTDNIATDATIVVCSQVCDPENVGVIVRSAQALGADRILLGPGCADPYSRRVLRTSMGAVLQLKVFSCEDLVGAIDRLHDASVQTYATVLDASATALSDVRRSGPAAILLGPEGPGLDAELVRACRSAITIPMTPGVDSLNVAAAAAIVIHHFTHAARPPAA